MTVESNIGNTKFLDRNPPSLPIEEIKQIALDLYGLSGEFKPLESERDQNYHIQTRSGDNYVFKLSNEAEDPGVIGFQIQALMHIKQQDPTLRVPRVLKTKKGTLSGMVNKPDSKQHIVHVLSYLPGIILDDAEQTPALWRNKGRYIARLDNAFRGFFHPNARHELIWDITLCASLKPHTIHIPDTTARQNIAGIFDHMAKEVIPILRTLRHQVIHNDADLMNTLTDPNQQDRIVGILDFGDMIYAPLILEPVVAADLVDVHADDYIRLLTNLVAGFDSVLPLEEEEIDLIYDLLLARYGILGTIIAWRRAMRPDQPAYLQEEEEPCWNTISSLMSIGRSNMTDALRRSCCFPPYCPVNKETEISDDTESLLKRRHEVLGSELTLFYTNPVHVERGRGPWLYDADGRAYLDCYNNVPVLGHCHPHVVKAVSRQLAALNLNTRYIYRNILDYAERIVSGMPDNLSVCVFVNSGSEANDIALRMARFTTGERGAIVMEDAYHGITEAIDDLSTYEKEKEDLAPYVSTLIPPNPYRGIYRYGEQNLPDRYATDTDRAIEELSKNGYKPAAFMIDTAFISNGIPDVPEGYLAAVTERIQAAGGLIIADEVQAGFGRSGSHMWGFMDHGIVPDLVTMGKPVGNGYPLGIVVTSPAILNAFVKETELFSTFGGNPVACAAGMAVLDVIEDENLISNACVTGEYLRRGIRSLMSKHTIIGDVRGKGMIAGVELVRDRKTLEPANTETDRLLDLLRENGVFVGSEGPPYFNILKIRPPMIFKPEHADILIDALDRSLEAL